MQNPLDGEPDFDFPRICTILDGDLSRLDRNDGMAVVFS